RRDRAEPLSRLRQFDRTTPFQPPRAPAYGERVPSGPAPASFGPALHRPRGRPDMASTAADYLCERLIEWGITTIYGYPGDGINGIMGALGRHADGIRFVQTRHEEQAAFMACAHAKYTGEVGVCMATSGPGAIHLLNGLYDAKLDHQPVVAIAGQTFVRALCG